MVDVEAVKARGRAMGLRDRRSSVSVGPRITRKWRPIPACLVTKGDTWVDHGVVLAVETGDITCIVAGIDVKAYVLDNEKVIRVFTEVDMRYAKVDGKGKVHVTQTSIDRDTFGGTLCGKTGPLIPVPDSEVDKVCAACTKAADTE